MNTNRNGMEVPHVKSILKYPEQGDDGGKNPQDDKNSHNNPCSV